MVLFMISTLDNVGFTTQVPVCPVPVGGTAYESGQWANTQGRVSLNMWSAERQSYRQRIQDRT